MSLKLLVIEEEPELEISHVPLSNTEEIEPDMEMPGEFLIQDDLDLLQDSATALESIGCGIGCEGMDIASARELDKLSPGFMRRAGGHAVFTSRPSLEGLSDGIKAVRDKFFELIQIIRKRVAQMYNSFRAWLLSKFSKPENQDVKEEINDFLSQTREHNAITYLSSLSEDPAEAAEEIGRLMDGETKLFVADFTDKLNGLVKRMQILQDAMEKNPTHFRLVKGLVTVEELFNEHTNSEIHQVLDEAFKTADAIMKARNSDAFHEVISKIGEISKRIDEIKEGTIAPADAVNQTKDDSSVSYAKLYENIAKAADDMKKVSIQQQVADMQKTVTHIIKISEGTTVEEVLEMIPEDVPADMHHQFAQKVVTFYRSIAKLGSVFLLLWGARASSISSINKVGEALLGLKEGFEKAVVASGASLTPEQKTQLTKALIGKGLKIIF